MILKDKDILILKNGRQIEYNHNDEWLLREYYDENLNCKKDENFSIVDILRPHYYSIMVEENNRRLENVKNGDAIARQRNFKRNN